MKKLDACCRRLLPLMALVLGMVFPGGLPAPAGADMTAKFSLAQKLGLQAKGNLGPAVTMSQTLFNMRLPLNISNMPGPWKNAKFVGIAVVYFLDGPGDTVGYATSSHGDDGMPLNISLSGGSYNGTVVIPIKEVAGTLTGKTCGAVIVVAELGSQVMFIGASKGGTAPNSGACGNMNLSGLTPGTILSN